MPDERAENIRRLVALLQDDTPLLWENVTGLLLPFPGWLQDVTRLRYARENIWSALLGIRPALAYPPYPYVTEEQRTALQRYFLPFSLLLDERYTILERACLIQEAGYDAVSFCENVLAEGRVWLFDEAEAALNAIAEHQNLLRGAERPETAPQELLRPAVSGTPAQDSLLLPSEEPQMQEPRAPFLRRIFRKR